MICNVCIISDYFDLEYFLVKDTFRSFLQVLNPLSANPSKHSNNSSAKAFIGKTLSWITLKNGETYFKNLWRSHHSFLKSMFGHFSTFCMTGLKPWVMCFRLSIWLHVIILSMEIISWTAYWTISLVAFSIILSIPVYNKNSLISQYFCIFYFLLFEGMLLILLYFARN